MFSAARQKKKHKKKNHMLALKSSKHLVNCLRVADTTSIFPLLSPTASFPEDAPGIQLPYVTGILLL